MPKQRDQAFTSLLYLAQSLPTLRRQSDEAASLVEAAIIECAIAMSGNARDFREQLDLATFLRYALEDVSAITPKGVVLLEEAISSLNSKRRNGQAEPSYIH